MGCDASIGLMPIGNMCIQQRHVTAVNLLEKNTAYTCGAGQQGAVGIDMHLGITHVIT